VIFRTSVNRTRQMMTPVQSLEASRIGLSDLCHRFSCLMQVAESASDLANAFATIASEILRLSQ
jgi:hypothetical protein